MTTIRRRLERLETASNIGTPVVAFFNGTDDEVEAQRRDWIERHGRKPDIAFKAIYEDEPLEDDGAPHAA
jgi:hypothetical protein